MTKSDLARALTAHNDLTLNQAEESVKLLFDAITEALVRGERVDVRGFGSFTVREYGAYKGRNPRTGMKIEVQPKRLPFFKVGKYLRQRLASGPEGEEGR